jgi:hypothetical protein
MANVETARSIAAPQDQVFQVVAHIEDFQNINPNITNVEFLTDSHQGVGTRFKETRIMKGRESTTTLEVTEYEPPSKVRIVSDEGGTIWDTVFTVGPDGEGSILTMNMDARPYKLAAKIITPLMMRMVSKAVEADMDTIKAHCDAQQEQRDAH